MNQVTSPLYLAGQTASGKTAVALALASQIGPVEIINADAFQVYRGMETISAAPSATERAIVPHHLFGILDPSEQCDAATFSERARKTIEEVGKRATPLVVGGSGLYLKAITHGLAPTPKANPALREELESESLGELVEKYKTLDPDGAAQTNLKNRRYVTRNLEICLLTGRPASQIKNEWRKNAPAIQAFYLQRPREEIYERINERTHLMFSEGVVEEVAALGTLSSTAAKAIGVSEIQSLLRNEIDRVACIEEIQKITRRYAKRQESWFRRETAFTSIPVAASDSPATTATNILSHLSPS